MSLQQELRPFQINAAEAVALTKAIMAHKDALALKNGGRPEPANYDKWPWQDLEEYILLHDCLEKLHTVTKG